MSLRFSNLLNKFFSKKKFFRKEIQFSEHNIEANYFHKNVLDIIKKLQSRNFDAYIVGGAIRDICFNLKPKDVDIVTNATPYEIKKIFRGSRIIGKRFKLVHIGYGRNIIEVSTFRKNAIIQNGFIKKDEKGKLLRDNLFGSEKEDVQRRDITINSLLYDPNKRVIIDYFDGFDDIKNKKIKVIGDPKKRFIEDPMRIIRIIRISSKLNLQIDDKLSRIMITNIDSIKDIPSSRLFDEICKMFTNGHAVSCIDMLFDYDVIKILEPRLSVLMRNKKNLDKMKKLLMASDQRFEKKLTISISFVLSSLFWILIKDEFKVSLKKNKLSKIRSIFVAVDNFFFNLKQINIPKRIQYEMKTIWVNQIRFENTRGKKPHKLLNSEMFKISYDFFLLRNQNDEISKDTFLWWADFYKKKS